MFRPTIGVMVCFAAVFNTSAAAAEDDAIKDALEKSKVTYQESMKQYREAVCSYFDKSDESAKRALENDSGRETTKQFRKAVRDYFDKEEAARKDGDKISIDWIKGERRAFEKRDIVPMSLPPAIQKMEKDTFAVRVATQKLEKAIQQLKEERKLFEDRDILPETIPVDLEQMRTTARTEMEKAFQNAVKEYTKIKRDAAATKVENELNEFTMADLPQGFIRRNPIYREKMLKENGGNEETERAVAMGLSWLAKQQKPDGHWEFDVGFKDDHIAATGMALLPFLAAGETHKNGKKYSRHVTMGLAYLAEQLGQDGHFKGAGNYSQAVATIPLCEIAGMTSDPQIKKLATLACKYIVKNQDDSGSWGYNGKSAGDTSIVGWQIQALQSGKLAGITIPEQTFKQAEKFLESVSTEAGSRYGYRTPGGSERLTAAGLLCRQYIGWTPKQPSLVRGVSFLKEKHKPTADDMYYTYYATQVFYQFNGPAWQRDWNPAMQKALLPAQNTQKTKGVKPGDIGCWNADKGSIGSGCGKLGTTCLSLLSLEVYYRYPSPNAKNEKKDGPK